MSQEATEPEYSFLSFGVYRRRHCAALPADKWPRSLVGPTSWNSLPDRLRDPTPSSDSFRGNYLNGIICELLNTVEKLCYKFTIDFDIDKWTGAPNPILGQHPM